MKRLSIILMFIAILSITGCSQSKVIINGYYNQPESMAKEETITIKGIGEGEFIEVTVQATISNFELVELTWDESDKELVEKEILYNKREIKNKTVVIETYMPEGIPVEKIKWQSTSGKDYEMIISDKSLDGSENIWEYELE